MRAALDFDSTIWPILPAMGYAYEQCPTWEHLPVLCGGVPQMLAGFDAVMTYEAMSRTPLLPGAATEIRRLAGQGVQFDVMTQRPDRFADDVARILHDNRIPFGTLDCSNDINKIALCLARGIRILIDDHPGTIQAAHDAGLTVMTLRYPYNADVVRRLRIASADSWAGLAPKVARHALTAAQARVR